MKLIISLSPPCVCGAFISLLRGGHNSARAFRNGGLVAGLRLMKTLTRIVVVALIVGAIYFATIGREQFYGLVDFFYEIINAIAAGYLKK